MSEQKNLHFAEVLNNSRLEILPYLQKITDLGFYLAGGTALALIFGHRESIDFDFFITQDIDTKKLFEQCSEIFSGFEVKKTFESENTLYITVNEVKISFFSYFYPMIGDIIQTDYLNLASIEDIGAMKLGAIQDRSTNKDYVDLYVIIKKIGLTNLLDSFFEKYGNIVNDSFLLKSLIYFDDIKEEKLTIKDEKLTFDTVKNGLEKFVKGYK